MENYPDTKFNSPFSIPNSQLSIPNSQLSILNSPFTTPSTLLVFSFYLLLYYTPPAKT